MVGHCKNFLPGLENKPEDVEVVSIGRDVEGAQTAAFA